MATLVPVPKLGQSEETVTLVSWHKKEGDVIKKGDVLFEVETDKSVLEIESQFEGTLLKVAIAEGQEVPVMSIAAVLGEPGEEIPPIPKPEAAAPAAKPAPAAPQAAPKPAPKQAAAPAPQAVAESVPAPVSAAPAAPAAPTPTRKAVSPRARRFAGDYLIDLDAVPGTGPGGRVIERDVEAYLDGSGYNDRKITPAALNLARKLGLTLLDIGATGSSGRTTIADVRKTDAERPKPMSKLRQVIARRLQMSKQTIPHFYVTVSVDMTELGTLRKKLKDAGYALSVNDFILKAVAMTLREFPQVNSLTEDGVNLQQRLDVNLGVAVTIDGGLVVPVIRNADTMDLDELHDMAGELIDKARDGKLTPDDMKGGTFTISNMGMMNVENFGAIINPGESAILAVGSARPTPVVNDEREIVVRDTMKMTLSADHRVVDGVLAATFANEVKRRLEDTQYWAEATAY